METRLRQLLIGHFLSETHSLGAVLKSSGLRDHGVTKRVYLPLVLRTHKSLGLINCIPKVYYSVRDIIKTLQTAKQQNQVSYNSGVWYPRKTVEGVWFFPWSLVSDRWLSSCSVSSQPFLGGIPDVSFHMGPFGVPYYVIEYQYTHKACIVVRYC